ncbi:MAG: sulfite exporter TauE/SafE family protein [Acetobacteraceae bacterium]|nr:sulfite exporter TauE/SafE family protein [Acetobacteraceae bacterium]
MSGLLDSLVVLCGPDQAARGVLLLPALLVAGLAGSVVHCTAMCGPFVLGQTADRMARLPAGRMCEAARLRGALLLPYHAGRLATYTALGVAAGWLGGMRMPAVLPGVLLALAGAGFLLLALGRAGVVAPAMLARLARAPTGFAALARRSARFGGLPLGLALGFLPCGMVYAALAAAAASGPVVGGAAMLAFGLGTVPALVAVALLGHAASRRWQGGVNRAAPWLLGANALLLATLAWRTLAA